MQSPGKETHGVGRRAEPPTWCRLERDLPLASRGTAVIGAGRLASAIRALRHRSGGHVVVASALWMASHVVSCGSGDAIYIGPRVSCRPKAGPAAFSFRAFSPCDPRPSPRDPPRWGTVWPYDNDEGEDRSATAAVTLIYDSNIASCWARALDSWCRSDEERRAWDDVTAVVEWLAAFGRHHRFVDSFSVLELRDRSTTVVRILRGDITTRPRCVVDLSGLLDALESPPPRPEARAWWACLAAFSFCIAMSLFLLIAPGRM